MKKFIILSLVLCLMCTSLFASRIGITYNDVDYIITTSLSVSDTDVAFFTGLHDALYCVKEGKQLYEINQILSQRTFYDATNAVDPTQKESYLLAFKDFMTNYTAGSIGSFNDLYPVYEKLMTEPQSFKNAKLIVEYGNARFYLRNL